MTRASTRTWPLALAASLPPVLAVVGALVIGAVVLQGLGASPLAGYGAMFDGAFGSLRGLSDTAEKAAPLVLVGVGIVIAFRANVINIGAEGQMVLGGLSATMAALSIGDAPAVVIIPLVLLAGFAGGALWGAVPGALKAYFGVNEILSTIMLNIVATQIMNYLLRGPMIDTEQIAGSSMIPQTRRLPPSSDLPTLVPGTRINAGVVVALICAVLVYLLLLRTATGFRLRAVGLSPAAARYAGIPVERGITLALTLSGALAGVAGAVTVLSSESHRMVTDGTVMGFTGGDGFNGIVVALFAALHPLWTLLTSFVFAGLLVGANAMQRAVQVPSALVMALNGLVVVFVVGSYRLRRWLRDRAEASERASADEHPAAPPQRLVATGKETGA